MPISSDAETVLVCGPRPALDRDRVVLSPASGVSFDGEQWHCTFRLRVQDGTGGSEWTVSGLPAARREAIQTVRDTDPAIVLLESPSFLREAFPDRSGRRLESRLRTAASWVRATFVAWQPRPPDERVREDYEVVVDRTTAERSGPSPRSRRRRDSNTGGTEPRAASRDR